MQVLDIANPFDRDKWQAAVDWLPSYKRDIHYEPKYILPYVEEEGCRAICLVASDVDYLEMQPLMLRGSEIGNVYCYGGRPRYGRSGEVFADAAGEVCAAYGLQSIRYRLHPFFHEWTATRQREKLIVYMDLRDDPMKELRKGHKYSIALARRSGVKVEESDNIDLFHRMYCAMCERNQAHDRWLFKVNLLYKLRRAYPDGFRLLIASVDGEPEAGCVLLCAHGTAYYQYAGSFGCHRDLGVGNLVVIESANLAKKLGYSRLHLGGGLTNDLNDTLLRFKSGFSKRRCWVYRYIFGQAKAEAA